MSVFKLAIAAARAALLLSEAWRASPDANTFEPTLLTNSPELTVADSADGPATPPGFTLLDNYAVTAEQITYFATLSWRYETVNSALRTLNVAVAWQQRGHSSLDFNDADKIFRLTTYAEN